MQKQIESPTPPAAASDHLRIDLLALDLETCERCTRTDGNLEDALASAGDVLEAAGVAVEVNRIVVDSVERARELRFVSSPTIRVNGRDIALELRESPCGSEACTDGCGDSIDCRVWVHRGEEHAEPPPALILDAILREVYSAPLAPAVHSNARYELPDNLARFFAAAATATPEAVTQADGGCCSPTEQAECCAPADKAECCAPADKAECCGAGNGDECRCR